MPRQTRTRRLTLLVAWVAVVACSAACSSGSSGTPGAGGTVGPGSGGTVGPGSGGSGATVGSGGAGAIGSGGGGGILGGSGGGAVAGTTGAAGRGGVGAGGAAGARAVTLPPTSLAVRFADAIMARTPDPRMLHSAFPAFEYNRGIILRGIEQVFRRTGDTRYLNYIRQFADAFVDVNGNVTMSAEHSFDNIQPAVLLVFLYEQTGLARYRMGAEKVRARYDTIPKNADGGYWHKQTYPNEMWLDSIYMAYPFLTRFARSVACDPFCNDTAVTQTMLLTSHVRNATTGLAVHAWDQDRNALWANATTGNSPEIWGRAFGWYAMALVDMLGDLPDTHAGRAMFLEILRGMAVGLRNTQDAATGLWSQVLDKGGMADNWRETSSSAMFVYALKVAVDRGYIDAAFRDVANKGWTGLQTQVTMDAQGRPNVTNAVEGMGVQVSYATYVNGHMRLTNSSHGYCAILLAASEMEATGP